MLTDETKDQTFFCALSKMLRDPNSLEARIRYNDSLDVLKGTPEPEREAVAARLDSLAPNHSYAPGAREKFLKDTADMWKTSARAV